MKCERVDAEKSISGAFASDTQTTVDVGDLIRITHTDGNYFGEVVAVETGDAGEVLIFEYVKETPEHQNAFAITLNRPFAK